jgi:hypothetical protein
MVIDKIEKREREGIVRKDMLKIIMKEKKGKLNEDKYSGSKKMKIEDEEIIDKELILLMEGFEKE